MSWVPDRYRELRALLRADRVEEEVDEELALHVELRAADLEAAGYDRAQAREEALRRFGDVRRVREEVCAIDESLRRERRRMEMWADLGRETRQAIRSLVRSPVFAAVAVLTLGLGIGANTAIFSVVNAVLMRPIPAPALERLFVVTEDMPDLGLAGAQLAPAEVLDLVERRDAFDAVTGMRGGDMTLTGHGAATRLSVTSTVGDFAGVFRLSPHVGRFYAPASSVDGTHRVAVVSHALWQQLSGGDPSFVGRTIELDGYPFEVIGVAPAGFRYPYETQVWMPLALTEQTRTGRGWLWLTTVARLAPGVTEARLDAQLDAEGARWNEVHHGGTQAKVLHATPFIEYAAGPLRLILLVLMGAVVFVLLTAAANVASLQLVRSTGRAREVAVRTALGAGRGRILHHLLLESLLLGVAGGALGLWLGVVVLSLFTRSAPAQQMNLTSIPLDGPVLAFAALITLGTVAAFGVLPALRASRVQPQDVLRESSRGATAGLSRERLLQGGVILQIALALVLLLGSALMIRTMSQLLSADTGFEADGVTTGIVSLPSARYDSPERSLAFFTALLERVRGMSGVGDAAVVFGLPFSNQIDSSPFTIPDRPPEPGEPERHAEARVASDGFFRTMGIPLLNGRDFADSDAASAPQVVIIDRTFAEQFFPGEDPIGRTIRHYTGADATIIGVAQSVARRQYGDAPKATAWYSYRQLPWGHTRAIAVRSALPAETVAGMLRGAVAELDPAVPLYDVQTMRGRIAQTLAPRRLALVALGGFAVLSLLLATLGVYGVMRYSTNQRTREIGIRVAVGARPGDVTGMIVREGAAIAAIGIGVGVIAAFWLTKLMAGILFGISPRDPAAFVGAIVILGAVSLLSSWLPARRATRVDPVVALRAD